MIRAVLAFAKTLDMDVTAEGIETQAQAVRLREIGCERGQGYLFGSPQPAEIIAKLLAASGRVATPLLAAAG
jgi:EAL domain-containing protein (putative c-di-GMP-specific phosphodiesterase class I)